MTPDQLRKARRKLGLTVDAMAAALGVHPVHIRRMEMAPGKPAHRPITQRTEMQIKALLRASG